MIVHHVISSRPLKSVSRGYTYKRPLIATEKNGDAANEFLSFGRYTVEDELKAPFFVHNGNHPESRDYYFRPDGFHQPGEESSSFLREMFAGLKAEGEDLLYIYLFGFGNNVHSEIHKQLKPLHKHYYKNKDWGSPVGRILLLSWPSQGKAEYKHGEEKDVEKMGIMLASLMVKLFNYMQADPDQLFENWSPKLVFHAQSMGNRILQKMMLELEALEQNGVISENQFNGFFHRLVMTGADLDEDTMYIEQDTPKNGIHALAKRVILFHNKDDKALWISRNIFGSGHRLGGDEAPDPRRLPDNVDLVLLTRKDAGFIGHNYFQNKESIIRNLFKALHENYFNGEPIQEGKRLLAEFDPEENKFIRSEYLA